MGNIPENSVWENNVSSIDSGDSITSIVIANRALGQLTNRTKYLLDKLYVINDGGTSSTELWSSDKIAVEIANAGGGTGSETGASILSKLITVDGTGSGLDADKLDGHNDSYFAVASDLSNHISTDEIHRAVNDNGVSTITLWSSSKISSELSAVSGGTGSETASSILSKLITVDGAGSGLDADKLDGHSSSYFAVVSDLSNHISTDEIHREVNDNGVSTITLWSSSKISSELSAVSGGTGSETGASILSKLITVDGTGSGLDADKLDGHNDSYFAVASDLSNHISTDEIHREVNDNGVSTITLWSSDKIAVEIANAGGETASSILSKLITVDGAGSGLDADLLNGHSSSYFATASSVSNHYIRDDVADTAAEKITFSSGIGVEQIDPLTESISIGDTASSSIVADISIRAKKANGYIKYETDDHHMFTIGGGVIAQIDINGMGVDGTLYGQSLAVRDDIVMYKSNIGTSGPNDCYITYESSIDAGHAGEFYVRIKPEWCVSIEGELTPQIDNTFTCGLSDYRWSEIYAANGTINTSDERAKENITSLGNTELDLIMAIEPISFKWKNTSAVTETTTKQKEKTEMVTVEKETVKLINGKWTVVKEQQQIEQPVVIEHDLYDTNGDIIGKYSEKIMEEVEEVVRKVVDNQFVRTHYGITSQQLASAITSIGLNPSDISAYVHDTATDSYGVRYTELVPLLIHAVQYLKEEIDILKQ